MEDTKRPFRILAVVNLFLSRGINVWLATFNNAAVVEIGVPAGSFHRHPPVPLPSPLAGDRWVRGLK